MGEDLGIKHNHKNKDFLKKDKGVEDGEWTPIGYPNFLSSQERGPLPPVSA